MNEVDLNTIMDLKADPEKNFYRLDSFKKIEEIRSLTRIFQINQVQQVKHKMLSIKNMATFGIMLSNN